MDEALPANSTISHYRVVSKLGEGGIGEVYLAPVLNWIAKSQHLNMKRCPIYKRVETENALAFCHANGAALVRDYLPFSNEV